MPFCGQAHHGRRRQVNGARPFNVRCRNADLEEIGTPTSSGTGMARKKTPTRGRGAGRRSTGNRSTGSRSGRSGRNTGRRTAPKKKVPLGVLAWTMLLLLILVMFLANRSAIRDVVDRTELLAVLRRSVDNAVGSPPGAAAPPEAPALTEAPEATETPKLVFSTRRVGKIG